MIVVLAALGLPRPSVARAGPDLGASEATASVALLPIVFDSQVSERDQQEFDAVVLAAFEHPNLELVRGARVERARHGACPKQRGQLDQACLRELGRKLGVAHVIQIVIHGHDRDFEVELQAQSVAGTRSPSVAEFQCFVCGIVEVRDQVAAHAGVLRDRVLVDTQPPRIVIEGQPEAAAVRIDGHRVGRLPYEGELGSGEHEIHVKARGYYDQFVPVNAAAGAVEHVVVELEARPQTSASVLRPAAWATIGLGIAHVVGGLTLVAIDDRPKRGKCQDPFALDINGECKWRHNSKWAGVGLFAVGLVAVNVGATLLLFDRFEAAPKSAGVARRRQRVNSLRIGVRIGGLALSGSF